MPSSLLMWSTPSALLVVIIIIFVITTTIIGHLAPKCSLGILFRTSRFCIFPSIPRRSVSSDHREDNDDRDHHDDNDDHDHHDDEDYDESVPYIPCRPMMIVKTIVMIMVLRTNHSWVPIPDHLWRGNTALKKIIDWSSSIDDFKKVHRLTIQWWQTLSTTCTLQSKVSGSPCCRGPSIEPWVHKCHWRGQHFKA